MIVAGLPMGRLCTVGRVMLAFALDHFTALCFVGAVGLGVAAWRTESAGYALGAGFLLVAALWPVVAT